MFVFKTNIHWECFLRFSSVKQYVCYALRFTASQDHTTGNCKHINIEQSEIQKIKWFEQLNISKSENLNIDKPQDRNIGNMYASQNRKPGAAQHPMIRALENIEM